MLSARSEAQRAQRRCDVWPVRNESEGGVVDVDASLDIESDRAEEEEALLSTCRQIGKRISKNLINWISREDKGVSARGYEACLIL